MEKKQYLVVGIVEGNERDRIPGKFYEIINNKIPNELVENFIIKEKVVTKRVFGKLTTVLEYELANGFTGIESTSCVDEKNYKEEVGRKILLERLKEKIWFGLGFALAMGQES